MTLIEFNECNCCFDDVYEYIKCNHGHLTCKECIFAGVKNAVGENKKLNCIDQSFCNGEYSDDDLFYCIDNDKKLMQVYKNTGNVINGNNEDDNIDNSKNDDVKDPSIIYCCVPIVLHDGCNKLTCPTCKKLWCWICKTKIDSYDHFNRTGKDRSKCPLYNEDNRINQEIYQQNLILREQLVNRAYEEFLQHREQILNQRRIQQEKQQNLLMRRQRKQEQGIHMCNAVKRNGSNCSFKAQQGNDFCGKHTMKL